MSLLRLFALSIAAGLFSLPVFASDIQDVVFESGTGGTVIFSHGTHTKAPSINDNCSICHDKLYKEKSKRPVTMAEMEKGQSCGACHGKVAFTLSACGRCHTIRDIVFPVQPTGDVPFVHEPHTRKFSCGSCHPHLFEPGRNRTVSMAEMEKGKSCGACHQGKKAFDLEDCSRCHLAGTVLMKVTGAGPSPFGHAFHTALYRCVDCHTKIFPMGYPETRPRVSMAEMDQGRKSCGACHDNYTAFTVRENCVRCHDM